MKVLVLLSRVPYPLEKGDKLRAFNHIKRLAQTHEVILCCLNDKKLHKDAVSKLQPYCSELKVIKIRKFNIFLNLVKAIFSKKPFQVAYFYHRDAQQQIDRIVETHLPKKIYCQLIRVSEYVRKYTIIPKTLDYMDTLSIGAERRIPTAPFYLRPLLRIESNRLKNYEKEVFDIFENKIIISNQDRDLIEHPGKKEIVVIPNGVDTSFFIPQNSEKIYDLVFTGNMNYPPNVDSARYIVEEILPLLREKYPHIRLLISGASPSSRVKSLKSDNVIVTGWVEDIRDSYAASRVFIAPMHLGTGLQNKLLESMAMKIPCITSALANNALGAEPEKHILIGNSPQAYANHTIRLLENEDLAREIAENGYRFIQDHFTWENSAMKLEEIFAREP